MERQVVAGSFVEGRAYTLGQPLGARLELVSTDFDLNDEEF